LEGVSAGDFLQAVGQTGGGEDDNGAGPGRAWAAKEAGEQELLEEPFLHKHGDISKK